MTGSQASRPSILVAYSAILCALLISSSSSAAPPSSGWNRFQAVIWQDQTPQEYDGLRRLGVTAARVQPIRGAARQDVGIRKVKFLRAMKIQPYIENMATDFYAAYHRWTPGRPVNSQFLLAKATPGPDGQTHPDFVRRPSLSSVAEQRRINHRLYSLVRSYAFSKPLYFSLGDETGIADLSAAWDFDYSPESLKGYRVWLTQVYGSLAALNEEWGTDHRRWSDIVPPTTLAAMGRKDENFSAWSDFKAWMDVAFSRAISQGSKSIHSGAASSRSAIEGAQMPGWGGYDYRLLANAVDVMEMWDTDANLEIARSFNPHLTILTTATFSERDSVHQAWRDFLRGSRGVVLWDETQGLVGPDGTARPYGKRLHQFLQGVNGPDASILFTSQPHLDPIAVLYSPESFRIQWMLDHRRLGSEWYKRDAEVENEDSAVRVARRNTLERLHALGYFPTFIDDAEIVEGRLNQFKALVLPQSLALSRRAANAIRRFVEAGGILEIDGTAARFDEHGRRFKQAPLIDLERSQAPAILHFSVGKVGPSDAQQRIFSEKRLFPTFAVTSLRAGNAAGVEQYVFERGCMRYGALLAAGTKDGPSKVPVRVSSPGGGNLLDIDRGPTPRLSRTMIVSSERPTFIASRQRSCLNSNRD